MDGVWTQKVFAAGYRGSSDLEMGVDDTRARAFRRRQDLAEELLGSRGIPVLREIEVERGTTRVHGPVQVHPASRDANIGFIHPPGSARPFQLPPDLPVQFGSIALHPTPNRCVVDAQVAFRHELFQITIAKREAEIPSDAEGDNLIREVRSSVKPRPMLSHPITLPKASPSCFATLPSCWYILFPESSNETPALRIH